IAHDVFLDVFGIDLDKPLTPAVLKILGDKDLHILYDIDQTGNVFQRDPAAALRFFATAGKYIQAYKEFKASNAADAKIAHDVFQIGRASCRERVLIPAVVKILGDKDVGILYDVD